MHNHYKEFSEDNTNHNGDEILNSYSRSRR